MNILKDAPIKKGTKVLVRCDIDALFENPESSKMEIDTFRLESGLETLRYIIDKEGFPIILGHIKKPTEPTDELSTKQLLPYYEKHLGKGKFELLENSKFDPRESSKNKEERQELAKEYAQKADLYVNESFATSHREYASIVDIPSFLPSFAGIRLQKEVENLNQVLKDPERPLTALIGGAKLESKKPTVEKFLINADYVLLGGKLGLDWQEEIPTHLIIPKDYAKDQLDIGPETIEIFKKKLAMSKTIIWAGPMGYYENEEYMVGTEKIAKAIVESNSYSIVGGGDTISALNKLGLLDKISFASTGGGAMLQYLTQETLPGLEVLK